MNERVLTTPVDTIVDIIKKNKTIKQSELQKKVKVSSTTIERWLVILEEFGVIKITYHNLEAYIHFVEQENEKTINIEELKTEFIAKCREKNLSIDEIKELWFKFLTANREEIKEEFIKQAKKQGQPHNKLESAWKKFEKTLEVI